MNIMHLMTTALALSIATPDLKAQTDIIGRNQITLETDRMTPEALWAMGRIGSMVASPDGKQIVYTVSYYSVKQNKSHTTLHIMNADGSDKRQLTTGAASEMEPQFIKNGSKIAFISTEGGTPQVWEMDTDGSNRRQLSFCKDGVGGFKFSPDGKQVVLVREVQTTRSIDAAYEDLPLSSGMVITDLNYKHWDHYVKTIPHIFLAQFDGEKISDEQKDLLEGEPYECPMLPFGGSEQFNWSPDSRTIVYNCRKKSGLAYAISTDSDIYAYDTQNGSTRNLCKPEGYQAPETDPTRSLAHQAVNRQETDCNMGYDTNPQCSPDGQYVAWLSMERDGYESDRIRLCLLNLETGEKSYLTESFESSVNGFCWNPNSKELYFTGVWHARSMVYSTNLKGEVRQLTDGDYDYASVLYADKQLFVTRHSISQPDDIYSLPAKAKKTAEIKQLTEENAHILGQLKMGEVKERWVKTSDGKDMLCWVVYPPHFDPNKKYPTLLFCQGGPQSPVSQFWSYRWNFQLMAAQDYIVVAPNRRGLPGFGMEWLEAISGDYSGRCMQDYLDAIDDVAKEPYVDRENLGCVGASFGGYSVYYLAGHHDKRFSCFIAHDGIFNTQQQYYETEEMWFPNWDLGAAPWRKGITNSGMPALEDGQRVNPYTTSPHLYVDKWDTPILCIHGEKDYRILSSQGESAFKAAIMRGVPAELLIFPDENHWVLKPQNGILWQRTFFRWLDRWLKK